MNKLMNFSIKSVRESNQFNFIRGIIITEQVSLLESIKYFISFWKLVLLLGVIAFFVGFVKELLPKEELYYSSSVVVPYGITPPQKTTASDLVELMQGAGSNISKEIGVNSFPGISENYLFQTSLLKQHIYSEKFGSYLTLGEYLEAINPPSKLDNMLSRLYDLPNKFLRLFIKDQAVLSNSQSISPIDTLKTLTSRQIAQMNYLSKVMSVTGGNSTTIETLVPEAKVSTRLNNLIVNALIKEVTRIKTARDTRNINLIKNQLDSARVNYNDSEKEFAQFQDENRGNNSASTQSVLQRLSNNYNLYYSIYSEIASEYELAQIELVKNTPFYEIVEPAYIPLSPMNNSFSFTNIIRSAFLGVFLGVFIIIVYTGLIVFIVFRDQIIKLKM